MGENNKEDDEISIDFGKIKNFFKKYFKETTETKSKVEEGTGPGRKGETKVEESKSEKENEDKESETKKYAAEVKELDREEDEISIDLSKITRFFKSKKESEETKEEKSDKEKEDDEISIDFGKIKSFFTRKKEGEKEVKETDKKEGEDEEELSFDFKKIKNIFKFSKEDKSTDDELTVDWKKFSNFFIKNKVLFLILIPILVSIFLRVQPAYLPVTDGWASNAAMNNLRNQVSSQINQQYPNLPDQNKNVLIDNEIQRILKENKAQIDQQIIATSQHFKSRLQDDSGQTYLLAIDPYFWMRNAKNIIENGHPGDEIRNGVPWDNHMFAPTGREVPSDVFHAYFIAFLFKFFSFFNKDLNLMKVAFYVPVIISALSVIPAFFITRKIGGNFGGFIAALIVAFHPSFLTRTIGGFSDTDAYNVMFPLFIAWFFLEALESKTRNKMILLSIANSFLIGLYSFTWGGWWYIFDFILASTISYIAYYAFVHKKELFGGLKNFINQREIKNSLIFIVIFIVLSGLFVSLFSGFGRFQTFYSNPLGFAKLKEVGINTVWPNVFTTVAEQNPASLSSVINQIGFGKSFFLLISLMGITLTLTRKGKKKIWFITGSIVGYIIIFLMKIQNLNTFLILISIPIIIRLFIALYESDTGIDIKYSILLILWFLATIYASTKGIRFMLLLVPPFAIGFGIALGQTFKFASRWIEKNLNVNRIISLITVAVVLLLVLVTPLKSAKSIADQEIPSFNDAWRVSLEKIKADSKPDAIINSWWDFGHWFKFWADRAVTFDGTSQNTPQAHWIGNTLLTDDEETAIGILRMLDCSGHSGGTYAFDALLEITQDHAKSIDILYEIMPEDKNTAEKILRKYVDKNEVENILQHTHCEPPENYFITSEDMVGKSGVWAHFGSWNFDRALIYNTLKKKEFQNDITKSTNFLQERFKYSENEAESLYYEVQGVTNSQQANNWIAPWPGYAGTVGCNKVNDETLACGNAVLFNLTSKEAFANSQQGIVHPKLVSFPTNEGIILKEYNESLIPVSSGRYLGIALIKNGDSYQALQMDSALTASMFTRLFYQEGIGLRHFKKFSDERSVFGGRIIVWKIDWEGNEINIIEEPKEVEEISVEETLEKEINITENISIENMSNTSKEDGNKSEINITENNS